MKTVSLAFNDLDFIIHPFEFTGMDRVVTVINDSVAIAFQHTRKSVYRGVL